MNRQPLALVSQAERNHCDFRENGACAISRTLWSWARLGGGATILAVLIARVGAGPFLDALRLTSAWSLLAAVGITTLTTLCCAWRWSLVAHALGVDVPLRTAVAAYYRSQFLNVTLPSGVLGDVHRAVRHGRVVGAMGRSLRSVAWERALGQAVQIGLTVLMLLVLPSPVHSTARAVAAMGVVTGVGVVLVLNTTSRGAPGPLARIAGSLADDLRRILLERRTWLGIVLASGVATVGHTVIFLFAVRTTGSNASVGRVLPLALVVLLVSAVPTNIAGWGPREGAAAWAFSSAGLSAAQGVTIAVVYGVMVLVATLPGAVMLIVCRRQQEATDMRVPQGLAYRLEGAARG